jgi:hypothetical protein
MLLDHSEHPGTFPLLPSESRRACKSR